MASTTRPTRADFSGVDVRNWGRGLEKEWLFSSSEGNRRPSCTKDLRRSFRRNVSNCSVSRFGKKFIAGLVRGRDEK